MFNFRRPMAAVTPRGLLASVLAAAALAGMTATAVAATANRTADSPFGHEVTCRHGIGIPVALAPGQPAAYTISGELCSTAAERHRGAMVQLLIPGATYTHGYWDFGVVDGFTYSYAREVAAKGIATFVIDPLGTGASSRPASTWITARADAFVAHQAVGALRDGTIAGVRFRTVIEVGHSLNSLIVWDEAITYHDVDGVIVTGAAHSLAAAFGQAFGADLHPAADDPKFAGSGLDTGYLTTVPGTRGALFYQEPDADPAVIALDEARKDVVSGTELNTALPVVTSTATRAIDVPVLDILGSNDFTTCGLSTQGHVFDCSTGAAVAAQEAPFYSPQAQIHACVIPGSGHDISLALNGGFQAGDAIAWSDKYVTHHRAGRLPLDCG